MAKHAWLLVFIAVILAGSSMAAQDTSIQVPYVKPENDTGINPFGTYSGSHESINLSNGNLHIDIPLLTLKGRNGQNLVLAVQYDSKLWTVSYEYGAECSADIYSWKAERREPTLGLGWRFNLPYMFGGLHLYDDAQSVGMLPYIFTTPDGTKHSIPPTGSLGVADSIEPSPVRVEKTTTEVIVSTADGTKYYFDYGDSNHDWVDSLPTKVVDASGNFITISNGVIRDNLNRQVTFSNSEVQYTDSSGTARSIQLGSTLVALNPTFSQPEPFGELCNGPATKVNIYYPSSTALSSITLPGGYTYSFDYNAWGELRHIYYPTGGHAEYDYAVMQYLQEDAVGDFREVAWKKACTTESESSCTKTTYAPNALGHVNNDMVTVTENADAAPPDERIVTNQYFSQQYEGTNYIDVIPPLDTKREVFASDGTLLRRVTTGYTSTYPPLPSTVTTTLDDNSSSSETFQYDTYVANVCIPLPVCYQQTKNLANVTRHDQYDSAGTLIRRTTATYKSDYYLTPHIMGLKLTEIVSDGATTLSNTSWTYDGGTLLSSQLPGSPDSDTHHDSSYGTSYVTRGKLTSATRFSLRNCGANSTVTAQYDAAGNLRTYTDSLAHSITLDYGNGATGSCNGSTANTQGSYVTAITRGPLTDAYAYNSCTGTLASSKDPNQAITTYEYDALGRLTATHFPHLAEDPDPVVATQYSPGGVFPAYQLTDAFGKFSKTEVDGLGRVETSKVCEGGSDGIASCVNPTTVYYTHDFRSRLTSQSNPYRGDAPDGTTYYQYDPLDRTTLITRQNGDTVQTSYDGLTSTVTDEANRKRQATTDVLGRLVQVHEPDPNTGSIEAAGYITSYSYDVLGNLTGVTQNGDNPGNARVRSFTYNGVSALCTATNPETGTISYAYNADGLMTSKTDAAGLRTDYTYEPNALHRLLGKDYHTDTAPERATPAVTYSYDSTAAGNLGLGRRTGMTDASGSTSWVYDLRGRVSRETQTINSVVRLTNYEYNLDGSIDRIKYPHASNDANPFTVKYAYDLAGRATSVSQVQPLTDDVVETFATGVQYAPHGALAALQYGSAIAGRFSYNNRLQPLQIAYTTGTIPSDSEIGQQDDCPSTIGNLQHLRYSFGASGQNNNGNVLGIFNCLHPTRDRSFDYDFLNRITQASTPPGPDHWSQSFTIDPWGNLKTITAVGAPGFSVTDFTIKNQFPLTDGYAYDGSGNMTRNGSTYYVYDAENQLKGAVGGPQYTYDGDGTRVRKPGKLYWTGTGSDALVETDEAGNPFYYYIFFNGKRIARIDAPSSGQ